MRSKAVVFVTFVVLLAGFVGLTICPDAAQPQGAQPAQKPKERTNPKDGSLMVYIPGGEFIRGSSDSDKNAKDDEKPQRRIYLDGFWIYKYEVTVAKYIKFCTETKRQMPSKPNWGWKNDHPIVNVDWNDATAYCEWAGGRLPTEAEWEKAARGTDGRIYPWGNQWDPSKCQCSKKKWGDAKSTAPIRSFPQGVSPYGVHDMAGNVWEWCADWYDESGYLTAPNRNPTGPKEGQCRALRGGSWLNGDDYCRAANRNDDAPAGGGSALGFRCVQSR